MLINLFHSPGMPDESHSEYEVDDVIVKDVQQECPP
ncbi:hypothetical protein A2U01_0052646, partial [Trifolium medium]|nr:hypothetical protein [Trifolium medium]